MVDQVDVAKTVDLSVVVVSVDAAGPVDPAGGARLVESLSVRELICALSALEDARRRCRVSTPGERQVAVALAADETRVLAELRRRRSSAVEALAPDPHAGRVGAGAEREDPCQR